MREEKMRRVLVLQSVNDALTARRMERTANSPRLSNYSIRPSYAIRLSKQQQAMDVSKMMATIHKAGIDTKRLLDDLNKDVEDFQPEFLVVHSGFVFTQFPTEILSVLRRLKIKHQSVRFGIQGGGRLEYIPDGPVKNEVYAEVSSADLFDNGLEMNRLLSELF
jgi:hypothetical protein